jgi:predicted metal-dependent HD superfamily phosphohydrolase
MREIFTDILARYSRADRLQHLTRCVEETRIANTILDGVVLSNAPKAMVLEAETALWLHGLVDVKERRTSAFASVIAAKDILHKLGLPINFINRVAHIIMAIQQHEKLGKGPAEQIAINIHTDSRKSVRKTRG